MRDAQIANGPQSGGVDKSAMEESYRRIWDEIASGIRPHVSADAFQRWFASIDLVNADEFALTFEVPNTIYQLWIESNYLNLVESAALAVLGSPRDIKFRVGENGKAGRLPEPRPDPAGDPL
jgi:chromosomal replication initiation ATPase DnaA